MPTWQNFEQIYTLNATNFFAENETHYVNRFCAEIVSTTGVTASVRQ